MIHLNNGSNTYENSLFDNQIKTKKRCKKGFNLKALFWR